MTESQNFEFDFDAWLGGATISEVSVDIFQNGELLGRVNEWQRRYKRAEQIEKDTTGEHSVDEPSTLTTLEEEGATLLAQLEESKTVWFLRALTAEDEIAIAAAFPSPKNPVKEFTEPAPLFIKNPTETQAAAYLSALKNWEAREEKFYSKQLSSDEYEQYLEKHRDVSAARGAERIHRAFVRIEKAGQVISNAAPSTSQIRRFPAAIGELQVAKLTKAIEDASNAEPEVPGDFLHLISRNDQD